MSAALRPDPPITQGQHRWLEGQIKRHGLDRERVKAWLNGQWGIAHLTEVPQSRLPDLQRRLPMWAARIAAEQELEREKAREAAQEREAIQWEGQG